MKLTGNFTSLNSHIYKRCASRLYTWNSYYLLTYLLTYSLTYLFTCLLTHSLTHLFHGV